VRKETLQSTLGVCATLILLLSSATAVRADGGRRPRIIRPPDDRTDYYATTADLQAIGDSVCAQMASNALSDNGDGTYTLNASTLGADYAPLCAGERFGDQPTAADCTATLIAPDVLVTAGHCLENGMQTDLNSLYFVFDYDIKQAGAYPSMFTTDQVFRASQVLGYMMEGDTANDWAVLKLDRAPTGRTPVPVRSSGSISVGQSVVAIGFGAGLPMKFSDNATVQSLVDFGFEADLDIIGGNSGGPIINADTGMIEGVLSADQGIDDYMDNGTCFHATVCPGDPGCDGTYTLLASVMNASFQTAIQDAIAGSDTGTGDGTGDNTDNGGDTGTGDNTDNGGDNGTGDDMRADADGDGVPDDLDFCPGTPAGAEVDIDGCEVGTGLCGAMGLIPVMFMALGLTLLRRRW